MVLSENFKGVSRKFQECLKEVSGKFQGYFKKLLRVFQQSFKGVSSSLKSVSRLFERSIKCV